MNNWNRQPVNIFLLFLVTMSSFACKGNQEIVDHVIDDTKKTETAIDKREQIFIEEFKKATEKEKNLILGSEAEIEIPYPNGLSVFPKAGYAFECIDNSQYYSIEVRSEGKEYATSSLRKFSTIQHDVPICRIAFTTRRQGKPIPDLLFFNSAFPIDSDLQWRAKSKEGKTTKWSNFRMASILDETFEQETGLFQFTDDDWEVYDGVLSTSAATENSIAYAAIPKFPKPRHPSEKSHQLRGTLTTFKVETFCSQPTCEVGLIGQMQNPRGGLPVRWYEVTITNDQNIALTYKEVDNSTGKVKSTVLKKLEWDVSKSSHIVRFGEYGPHIRIEIDGRTQACLWRPRNGGYIAINDPSVGIRWKSTDDDSNVNSLRVDYVHTQMYPGPDWGCAGPLPPLKYSNSLE
ncbi:hypothetical protein QSV34_10850 [Porticoccus sp. W117]|uniref:hypothetical protein n=1 Tax=Porticoccus sp. W117 TaxID=3054777 RepID=UPI0025977EC9|nr:hypothetical protein [Porticoccus sp. W117]MDM3871848.1 hypothetical protein [Porticoccus sp. W117]